MNEFVHTCRFTFSYFAIRYILVILLCSNFHPSIPGLMWSYNKKVFKHDPEGIPLNELLLNCPHVKQQKSRVFLSNPSYGEHITGVYDLLLLNIALVSTLARMIEFISENSYQNLFLDFSILTTWSGRVP